MKWINLKRFVVSAMAFCFVGGVVKASVTNVIWEAAFSGTLGIQAYKPDVTPRMDVAQFKKKTLLRFAGLQPNSSEVLALNIDMAQGRTNFYITNFNKDTRQNGARLSVNEKTTIISDGADLTFSFESFLVPTPGSTNFGGGFIRFTGRGRLFNGVPSVLKGAVTGYLVDQNPSDLNGTTGLLLRASISTTKAPLRVLPQN
ncbi:MAG: hypothetical protein WCS70_06715 [Verrucomicrobiota bacterium]